MCTPWQQRHRKKLGKRLGPGPKKPQSQSIHYATASIHVVFAVVIVVVIVIIVWWPLMIKGVKLVHADTKIEPGTTMKKCRFNYIAFKSRRRCQTLSCEARVVRTGCLMSRWTPLETCLDMHAIMQILDPHLAYLRKSKNSGKHFPRSWFDTGIFCKTSTSNVNLRPQHIIPVPSVATFLAPTSTRDHGLLHSFWIEFWPMPETSTTIWATLEIGWWLACLCFNQKIYTQKRRLKNAKFILYFCCMICSCHVSWSLIPEVHHTRFKIWRPLTFVNQIIDDFSEPKEASFHRSRNFPPWCAASFLSADGICPHYLRGSLSQMTQARENHQRCDHTKEIGEEKGGNLGWVAAMFPA